MRLERLREHFNSAFNELSDCLRAYSLTLCSRLGYNVDDLDLTLNFSESLPGVHAKIIQSDKYDQRIVARLENKIESTVDNIICDYIFHKQGKIRYADDLNSVVHAQYLLTNLNEVQRACIN